jgi:hypothetical protein
VGDSLQVAEARHHLETEGVPVYDTPGDAVTALDSHGVIALDGRIRVAPTDLPAERRLAIQPYPCELEEEIELADGCRLILRPRMIWPSGS